MEVEDLTLKKSSGHLSKTQKIKLLDLMRDRPHLRSGRFTNNFTQKDGRREWELISSILNAIPGSQKDWRLWRKTWQDLQSKAKTKKASFNKSIQKTGGGPAPDPIDDFDEGVAALINKNSVDGHDGVAESIVEFFIEDVKEVPADVCVPLPLEIPADADVLPPPLAIPADDEILPPPLDFLEQDQRAQDEHEQDKENGKKTGKKTGATKKKINMKTLLKEKIELKRKLVDSTIQFQTQCIRLEEDRNKILKELLSKFNEGSNK